MSNTLENCVKRMERDLEKMKNDPTFSKLFKQNDKEKDHGNS